MLEAMRGRILAAACLVAGLPQVARGLVLDFEEAPTDQYGFFRFYGGFHWLGPGHVWEKLDGRSFCSSSTPPGPGYCSGTTSGSYVAFNFDVGSIETANRFDFEGAYINAGFRDDLQLIVEGYLGSNLLHSTTIDIDTLGPSWYSFDFTGIDRLVFTPAPPSNPAFGPHFVLDDFTYTPAAEPSALALVVAGLTALLLRTRRERT